MAPQYPDPGGAIQSWVRKLLHDDGTTDTGQLLLSLTYAFKETFKYERRSAPGTRAPADTLHLKRGSCRDLALLMIEALRSLGFAARFVSGYLYVPSCDGPSDSPARVGGGSTHAWCEVYLPGAGWVEFDPTNAIVGNRDLIRVAVARDPSQAVPLSGTYFGDAADFLDMTVEVKVRSEPGLLDPSAAYPAAPPEREARARPGVRTSGSDTMAPPSL
jgi:transglutaminase-like putative cysteine protease